MPIYFKNVRGKLLTRLRTLDRAFERHAISPAVSKTLDKFALQEGLVSSLWQAWCEFCREAVIGAVQGAETTQGNAVASPNYAGLSELEIGFVAKQLANAQKPGAIKPLKGRHQEPTWGDVNKLTLIVAGLSPSNATTMLSGFGSSIAIADLQVFRNASAHICNDTLTLVRGTRVRYKDTDFRHPSDAIKWVDPTTNDYLWRTWIDEMDFVSDIATQ